VRTTTIAMRPLPASRSAGLEPLVSEFGSVIASGLRRLHGIRVVRWDERARPDLWVEASCRGSASALALRVQLIDGASGRPAWSGSYDGDAYQILERESAIAAAVARAVHARVAVGSAPPASADAIPRDVLAQLLRSEALWFCWSREDLRRSARAWESAARAVPGLAQAQAGWSLTESIAGLLGYEPPAAAARQARALARRAGELDDALPTTQLARGLVRLLFDGDVAGADTLIRSAIADDGEDARGPVVLAILALAEGRFDEAARVTTEAADQEDPHATAVGLLHARAQQASRDWAGAAAAYRRVLELEPGLEAARVGRAECLLAHGGRRTEALRTLRRLCASDAVPLPDATRACIAAGETDRARSLLWRAVADGWPHAVLVPRDPAYARLGDWPSVAALRAAAAGAGGAGDTLAATR
jgi:tetratricopeptide (TPR) repeat protein